MKGNRFLEYPGEPVLSYRKVSNIGITGRRLHPITKQPIVFVLMSERSEFNPETDVVELYTEEEVRYFQRANSDLIRNGALVIYSTEEVDEDRQSENSAARNNMMSDDDIRNILKIRKFETFQTELEKITSIYTIIRVKEMAAEIGVFKKFFQAIEARFEQLK